MDQADRHYFVTSAFSLLTGFALYKVINSQWHVINSNKKISTIQKTKIKSVDEPVELGQTAIIKGSIGFNPKDFRNQAIQKPLSNGKKQDFLIHLRFIEGIYSNDGFTGKDDYKIDLKESVGKAQIQFNPSFLIKGKNSDLAVYQWDHVNYSPLLEIIKMDTQKRKLTLTQKLQTLMFTYFRSIGTLVVRDKSRPSFMRGIQLGTREVQTGIKMGSSIMALGTIGVTTEGILFLEPQVFFRDRLSIITNLKEIVRSYEDSRNFWSIILIVGGVYVGRRVYKYNKKHNVWEKIKQKYLGIKPIKV